MSSEKKSPPTIVPKAVQPRPDEVTSTATRPPASNGTARTAGGGTTNGAQNGASAPVPPPPPATGATPSGSTPASEKPVPPPPPAAGGPTARSGALKAAAAAMATAKAAAKKLAEPSPAPAPAKQSEKSSDEIDDRTVPRVNKTPTSAGTAPAGGTQEVPAMHYTAAGFSGTASPVTGATPVAAAAAQAGQVPRPAQPATGATPAARPADGPRRVRLAISRVDPWSVMKLSFLLAVAIGIMTVVATAVLWTVLDGMGVFTETDALIRSIVGQESKVDVLQFVEFNRVVALSTLIAIVNMVLITALSTIMAFIYNIVAAMVGGIHLTLTDD
ncbi:DUF3566 domain-containing protein [Oerskovia sp. NPDC057915]|uniref:DUF3566 domain-containing protein n=1 Tax=Oerskovia sp. NPDC057915 TaxID=3346280 RepID=UPI0036DB0CCD